MPTLGSSVSVDSDTPAERWRGVDSGFALFGEVLWTGVIVSVAALGVVTLPLGLAVGAAHLGRYLRAEDASIRLVLVDLRAGLAGGLLVGAGAVLMAVVLLLDVRIAGRADLPGATAVLWLGLVGLLALGMAVLRAAVAWATLRDWRRALRAVPGSVVGDLGGSVLAACAVGLVAVLTWQLPPLVVPALGCLTFAGVALAERRR